MDRITHEEYHKKKDIGDIWVDQTTRFAYVLIAKDPDHWAAYKWEYIAHPELDIKKEMEWISVEDRLPEKTGQYLIAKCDCNEWYVLECGYDYRHKSSPILAWINFEGLGEPEYTPTHWMPLPKPPKKEAE